MRDFLFESESCWIIWNSNFSCAAHIWRWDHWLMIHGICTLCCFLSSNNRFAKRTSALLPIFFFWGWLGFGLVWLWKTVFVHLEKANGSKEELNTSLAFNKVSWLPRHYQILNKINNSAFRNYLVTLTAINLAVKMISKLIFSCFLLAFNHT